MHALLVSPAYPETYWSLHHMLPLVGSRWLLPPLGLLTVAALLPRHWDCRLVDLACEELSDEQLRWADVVLLSGMLVQRRSMHQLLERSRRLGVPTLAGGPYATAMPDELGAADHLVLGEGEEVVPRWAADFEAGRAGRVYREARKPDLGLSPIPRFDLIRPGAYQYMALQFSRGCPFLCEFCDITVLYGRRPRTKAPEQVIAELDAIRATGFDGRVMFVDDNFIADPRATQGLLPEIAAWRHRTRSRMDFFTEASINLVDRPELVDAMIDAGFAVVFVGIETPSEESLRETRKLQNLGRDLVAQVRGLRERGLDVWAGFIVGFDHDGPEIFDRMTDFIQEAGIPFAMLGMLTALPGTPLYERLAREGRLLQGGETGDMFALSNLVPRMGERALLEGYTRVLAAIYQPERYFARCREHLRYWRAPSGSLRLPAATEWRVLLRSVQQQGLRGGYRRSYWTFLLWVLRHDPRKLGLAIAQACAGHHFIRYTQETVLPALQRRLEGELESPEVHLREDEASVASCGSGNQTRGRKNRTGWAGPSTRARPASPKAPS